ncbi:MAG: complex I subunit 5 family protein, partial [Trueperaceae bacterium]|nr:complex I subunit 5 family protein [Trueperaceae bacterium]
MNHAGPLWLVLAPALAAPLLLALARRRVAGLGALVALVAAATFASTVGLAPAVLAHGRVVATLPAVLGELRFTLDGVGLLFALVATFAWTIASVYATGYLHGDAHAPRYHATSLAVLSAMLGVVVAGDLITLYVFFEWLGLVAYLYVVHVGGPVAERAGLKYLVLTLLGGFAVLAGALLVDLLGGGDLTQPLLLDPTHPGLRATAALLLVLGFGVKAGALGLHLWLPDAHSAAPAPASALLSGVMIKAGAYGILRTLAGLYGGGTAAPSGEALALAVLWWGVATMSIGVVMALAQTHAKRLLAYSSVSQMGFVLAGFGAAAYLADHGAVGWTGSLLHVANHALAKGLLFLGVGAAVHATGETDLRRLGGLARRMPWTFAAVLIGAGGIAGLPGLNGFVSKSVLHHTLVHAAEHGGAPGLVGAEWIFVATTVGTAAALVKLVAMAFLGRPAVARPVQEAPWTMRAPMLVAAGAIVALGVAPGALAPLLASAAAALRPTGAPDVAGVAAWVGAPIGHAADLRAA